MTKLNAKSAKPLFLLAWYLLFFFLLSHFVYFIAGQVHHTAEAKTLLLEDGAYPESSAKSILETLQIRIAAQPFNLIALLLFVFAVIHTFFAHKIALIRHKLLDKRGGRESFWTEILHFLSEVEVIFGIWAIPLVLLMSSTYDWTTTLHYLNTRNYDEAIFVVVIMALVSTKPIMQFAKDSIDSLARLSGDSVRSWWMSCLTVGPAFGSFVTEPGAMAITALLLSKQIYFYRPSKRLAYATLGLLFTNVSIGGVLTNFAAPAVLIVSERWGLDVYTMFSIFGWKALLAIATANIFYLYLFRKDFDALEVTRKEKKKEEVEVKQEIPLWITMVHLCFLAWIVVHVHFPIIFIASFLLFLGFMQATSPYQEPINLRTPVLVGFFIAGLLVHGGLQAWWIAPLLQHASSTLLFALSFFLTWVNDNAEITYLASLVPEMSDAMRYAVIAGAVAGGGATVIANAPNPAGQAILSPNFEDGIAPLGLLTAALPPAIIAICFFYFL